MRSRRKGREHGALTSAHPSAPLTCSTTELVNVTPPLGETCQSYMAEYIGANGGALYGGALSTISCQFCTVTESNTYLDALGMSFDTAWRNFDLMWVYVAFK